MAQNTVNFQNDLQLLKKEYVLCSCWVQSYIYMPIRLFVNHGVQIFYICATQSVVLESSTSALRESCKLSGAVVDPLNQNLWEQGPGIYIPTACQSVLMHAHV